MSEHKLEGGKRFIAALAQLGRALGYAVRTEMPVEQRPRPPAVDVAWFADDDEQRYPLMIFEVESAATNAMANNPAKVFGQPSDQFERPLFFFHIVLQSGAETSRIDNLKGVFGSHNYRVYRLDDGMAPQLVRDILSQHRRIRRSLQVGEFARILLTSTVLGEDHVGTLDHAANLGLRGAYLSDLAELAVEHAVASEVFLRHLDERLVKRRWDDTDEGYRTWLGRAWCYPIHIGLLSAHRPGERTAILDQLVWWQERSSFMSQIGPHLGLSRDYDEFIYSCAGGLFALVGALMIEHREALQYIVQQLLLILRRLAQGPADVWLHCALWALHVAATADDKVLFDEVREFANERGGAPLELLYGPPVFVSTDEDDWWRETLADPSEPVPQLVEFRAARSAKYVAKGHRSAVLVALGALVARQPPLVRGEDLLRIYAAATSKDNP